MLDELTEAFAQPLCCIDTDTGELIHSARGAPSGDLSSRLGLLAEVARRGKPEIIEEIAPLSVLAIPLGETLPGEPLVAVGVFVNQRVNSEAAIAAAASAFATLCRAAPPSVIGISSAAQMGTCPPPSACSN